MQYFLIIILFQGAYSSEKDELVIKLQEEQKEFDEKNELVTNLQEKWLTFDDNRRNYVQHIIESIADLDNEKTYFGRIIPDGYNRFALNLLFHPKKITEKHTDEVNREVITFVTGIFELGKMIFFPFFKSNYQVTEEYIHAGFQENDLKFSYIRDTILSSYDTSIPENIIKEGCGMFYSDLLKIFPEPKSIFFDDAPKLSSESADRFIHDILIHIDFSNSIKTEEALSKYLFTVYFEKLIRDMQNTTLSDDQYEKTKNDFCRVEEQEHLDAFRLGPIKEKDIRNSQEVLKYQYQKKYRSLFQQGIKFLYKNYKIKQFNDVIRPRLSELEGVFQKWDVYTKEFQQTLNEIVKEKERESGLEKTLVESEGFLNKRKALLLLKGFGVGLIVYILYKNIHLMDTFMKFLKKK